MSNAIGRDQSVLLIPDLSITPQEHVSIGNNVVIPISTFGQQYPFSPSAIRKQDEMQIFKTESRNLNPDISSISEEFYLKSEKVPNVFNATTYEVENLSLLKRLSLSLYSKQSILLIFILAITLVLVSVFITSQFQIQITETFTEEIQFTKVSPRVRPTPKISLLSFISNTNSGKVSSAKDLQNIGSVNTVVVQYLTDDLIDIPLSANFQSIKNLEIVGPVSEEWLITLLLSLFPNIQTLSLDIDKLCVGSRVKDRNALQSLKLQNVHVLNILNSNMCLLANWVYGWDLPMLTKFSIKNSDISKLNYKQINEFLENNNKMLTDVSILNCFVCDDCILPESSEGLQLKIEEVVSVFDYND